LFATLLALYCLTAFAAISSADIHLIRTKSWEYGGYPRGDPQPIEVWLSPAGEARIYKNKISIVRYDKGVKWIIDTDAGTYKEIPLESGAKAEEPEEKLHNEGYVYKPAFDWIFQDADEDTVLCGIPCKKYILEGDADYAEKVIEIWAAEDIGISIDVNEKSLHYFHGYEMADLFDQIEELEGRFILYEKSIKEAAIAPTNVVMIEITKLEDATPPEGIYQLPDGLKRID
jgi:hypothetical protein